MNLAVIRRAAASFRCKTIQPTRFGILNRSKRCQGQFWGGNGGAKLSLTPFFILQFAWAGGKAQGARGRLRYADQDLFRYVGGPLVDGTFIVIRDQDMGKETG